jgi:[protein-PII] uridylyltransferase
LVLKNMRRFRYAEMEERFPVVAQVANNLPKIELLYLAGLFHDIAKGRGGDHSELGAVDAYDFCINHGLGKWDAGLVSWLALNHLVMSVTAQKKDVSDPDVINEFAQKVGDVVHLDYLYSLTVADICATNPTLWNS